MDTQKARPLPPANPLTQASHRRQVQLQILLPILVVAVILLAVAVLATRGTNPQVAQWGNVSAILVILPWLLVLFISLVIVAGLIYLVMRILAVLPPYAHLAQITIDNLHGKLKQFADLAAKPVIDAGSLWAGFLRIFGQK